MKKTKEKKENKCAFCGKPTNYYYNALSCYICPTCLGEYKKALAQPTYYSNWNSDVPNLDTTRYITGYITGGGAIIGNEEKINMKICEPSPLCGRDDGDDLHFYCDYCGEEMDYDEIRECKAEREKCPRCGRELGTSYYSLGVCLNCGYKLK